MRIGLVGCVKQKRAFAAPAGDLYTSPLFGGRRRYVERTCDYWFILSAKHGLVDKDQVLEPYDVTLKTVSTGERRRWSHGVLAALRARLGDLRSMTFEIHAGSEYRDYGLVSGLVAAGAAVEIPTGGLGLGSQLAFNGSDVGALLEPEPRNDAEERPSGGGRGMYAPLGHFLRRLVTDEVTLTSADVQRMLLPRRPGGRLPASARLPASKKSAFSWPIDCSDSFPWAEPRRRSSYCQRTRSTRFKSSARPGSQGVYPCRGFFRRTDLKALPEILKCGVNDTRRYIDRDEAES